LKSWRAVLLLQDLRREGTFACTHTLIVTITSPIRFLFLAGSDLSEFHTEQWGEHCSVPVGCLPHVILQLIVCRSPVHCLKSWRVALLSQDLWREGAFARTHTSIVAITSLIHLLYWLGTCVNFIPNSERSVALFLSVVCPTLFCNQWDVWRNWFLGEIQVTLNFWPKNHTTPRKMATIGTYNGDRCRRP
jgi:hypothetical protein